jgi:Ca2+/H+ antiporter
MDLNFEIFMVVLLIMSILVVGRFLQDGSSNYLEGTLLVVSTLATLDLCPHFHYYYR